jgi:hypothetical protein
MSAAEFNPDKSLREATAQEIQFELLRRTQHNALRGDRVLESLLAHRDLWLSLMLDRLFVWSKEIRLPVLGLITLRDLPYNDWNADTLYILAESPEKARALVALMEQEDWGGEPHIIDDPKEVSQSVGSWDEGLTLVQVWWD